MVRYWCHQPRYLDTQAALVSEILEQLPESERDQALLVFSAHGLPQRVVDHGDPYPEEIEASVAGVMQRLPNPVDHVVAYQSRAGPMQWIGPDTIDVVKSAGEDGRRWLGVVPISFVSEHVETLHELDIELRSVAQEAGILAFHRARCLDVDPVVGPLLADIIQEHL